MRFLYRYYYTFFSLHLKDNQASTNKSSAWIAALFQVGLGTGGLLLNIFMIADLIINGGDIFGSHPNKFIVGLIATAIPTAIIYYLLFSYYGVSKDDGLTEKDSFVVTAGFKYFFWTFWILSTLGLVLLGRLLKVSMV